MNRSPVRSRAVAAGYRSGLEEQTLNNLKSRGVDAQYEPLRLAYTKPVTHHAYTPDFILPNGIIVETKGRFMPDDRKKHLLLKAQHPDLDIRFVFSRAATRLNKTSKTTYGAWCEKAGFLYADKVVPQHWLDEAPDQTRLEAIKQATK